MFVQELERALVQITVVVTLGTLEQHVSIQFVLGWLQILQVFVQGMVHVLLQVTALAIQQLNGQDTIVNFQFALVLTALTRLVFVLLMVLAPVQILVLV